ncbi:MAG: aspartate--tRNA ligase [Deltaproteobacteria bacterium]|nr:aspartate--tRNA ligase [Deltaproteobacteria bacterium]
MDTLGDWKRTHDCGALRAGDAGREVVLMGWVHVRRDLGHLIFIDLRDREGITQVVFDPQVDEAVHERAHVLRSEWVVAVRGETAPRLEGQENPDMATGAVEVRAKELKILNRTEIPPFQVAGAVDASETLRLKHRYLELRRPRVFRRFRERHRIAACVRDYLNNEGFLEVETPFLTKSTPEGARDYLVPSRVNQGLFYALPQSPQLFKQLLMVSGFDRYYQIVRCFRDEDLRADRQPEFTQVDLEMSFADEEAVMALHEGMMAALYGTVHGKELTLPFPRLTFREAMDRFGTDRPDTRFGLEIHDLTGPAARSEFRVFRQVIDGGGVVKAVTVAAGAGGFSRKDLDELGASAAEWGAKGLAWAKVTEGGWQSPIKKFFPEGLQEEMNRAAGAGPGDLLLLVSDRDETALYVLGMLRLHLARRLGLVKDDEPSFVWVTEFPLLEHDEEGRLAAVHHPFTSPMEEDLPRLADEPEAVRARAYDLVLNGSEIGGGSVRIHTRELQDEMFRVLGITTEEAEAKFGFFLEALRYGAPPHAGMALGFDRLVAVMTGAESIREVIAFPKTQRATCPLTGAPSRVDERQLEELGLSVHLEE